LVEKVKIFFAYHRMYAMINLIIAKSLDKGGFIIMAKKKKGAKKRK